MICGNGVRPSTSYRCDACVVAQVELHVLDKPGQVGNNQDSLIFELADKGQHLGVVGTQQLERSPAEAPKLLAQA